MFVTSSGGRFLMCALLGAIVLVAIPAIAAPSQFTAGTGKAGIDPATALFPIANGTGDAPFSAIHDPLFARALVLQKGGTKAIVVVADVIALPDDIYDRLVNRISTTHGVAKDHVWLTATHVHPVPWSFAKGYEQSVTDGVMAAVARADRHQEPVSAGFGTGKAYININRDEETANGFILGQDPSGPSDKTVRVAGFFRADGTPLAILANYAVHAVTLHSSVTGEGHTSLVSADIPGATNAFVDAHYGNTMTQRDRKSVV